MYFKIHPTGSHIFIFSFKGLPLIEEFCYCVGDFEPESSLY